MTQSGISKTQLAKRKPAAPDPVARWEAKGRKIWETVNRSAWELGDWWNAGEPYGDRVQIAERIGWDHKTCRQAGWVANAYEVSRRRDTLSWSHHVEVARLPAAEQDVWLDKAEAGGWTRLQFREALASLPEAERPALPAGTFDVLLADPPWRYDASPGAPWPGSRRIENHYPTLQVDEIATMEVPSAGDAVLFLWATNPLLLEAIYVLEAWGFTYRTNLVWVKDKIGMGVWARQRHELLLVGTKGQPGAPDPSDRVDSVIEAPRGEHSAKPEIVYELIETAMPDRAYLELFARSERDGWTSWGNEVP